MTLVEIAARLPNLLTVPQFADLIQDIPDATTKVFTDEEAMELLAKARAVSMPNSTLLFNRSEDLRGMMVNANLPADTNLGARVELGIGEDTIIYLIVIELDATRFAVEDEDGNDVSALYSDIELNIEAVEHILEVLANQLTEKMARQGTDQLAEKVN